MECFRQIIRCIKAPFKRQDNQRAIEIGLPTNFRKEELPACFSDAESVVSPKHAVTELPILTKQLQNVEATKQPRDNSGDKDGGGDRDGGALATDKGHEPQIHSEYERQTGESRPRLRLKIPQWFKLVQSSRVEEESNNKQP